MDKLNKVSYNLIPLVVTHVIPGQLCAVKFPADGDIYRARVIEMEEPWMLPHEFLALLPAVVKVDNGVLDCQQWTGGHVSEGGGGSQDGSTTAKFFFDCNVISFP